MTNPGQFSVGQLLTYSDEETQSYLDYFLQRSKELDQLKVMYNDKVRSYLNDKSLSSDQSLSLAETWSGVRDTAKEMSDDAMKKAFACRVELDLRDQ